MNRATPRKSNHPIYPRPVSPLHYEPLYIRPEDVLWEDSASSESDIEVRAAKRQRIEKFGEQYLRGDGLFILSAGIKGPLGEGWKNPWKKRRKLGKELGGSVEAKGRKEVPETVERVPNGVVPKEKNVVKGQDDSVEEERELEIAEQLKDSKRLPDKEDPFVGSNPKLEGHQKPNEQDNNTWLKKNHVATTLNCDIYPEEDQELQRSPSKGPVHLHQIERDTSPSSDHVQTARYRPAAIVSSNGRAEDAIKLLRRREVRRKSSNTPQVENMTGIIRTKDTETAAEGEEGNQPSEKDERRPVPIMRQDDANHMSGKQTRSGTRKTVEQELPSPPAENSPGQMTDPEDQNRLEHEQLASDNLEADDQAQARASQPRQPGNIQPPDPHGPEFEKPIPSGSRIAQTTKPPSALSRETTSTTVVSVMPSAQVAATVQAPPPNESVPSTGDKLSEQEQSHDHHEEEPSSYLSTQAAIAAANLQLQKELTTPQTIHPPASRTLTIDTSTVKPKSKSGITPFSAFNKPNHRISSNLDFPSSLNTQEMLNAVSPFDLTTTIKKVPPSDLLPQESASPTTFAAKKPATRSQQQKPRKRASFAPPSADTASSTSGSSQGSIKASLKVSKNGIEKSVPAEKGKAAGDSGSGSGSGPSLFGKFELDMETSPSPSPSSDGNDAHEPQHSSDNMQRCAAREQMEVSSKARKLGGTRIATTNNSSTSRSYSSNSKPDAQKLSTPRPVSSLNHHILKPENPHQEVNSHSHSHRAEAAEHENDDGDVDGGEEEEAAEEEEEGKEGGGGQSFDLSAAMDEVGSFLQSWDVEREVVDVSVGVGVGIRRGGQGQGHGGGGACSLRGVRRR